MARYLHIKAGFISNIVEYSTPPPDTSPEGDDIVPSVTGLESVGDAFDIDLAMKLRRLDKQDLFIFQELFRLTNEVRVLQAKVVLTAAQYRTSVITAMT